MSAAPTATSHNEKAQRVIDALSRFPTKEISVDQLVGQGDAFEWCLEMFNSLEKTKRINHRHGSYGLKHVVEDPAGRYGVRSAVQNTYRGYVFEGTLILAAKTAGFSASGDGLKVAFNFSEKSLVAYISSVAVALRDKMLRAKLASGGDITKCYAFDGERYYTKELDDSITELTRGEVLKRLRFAGFSHPVRGGRVSPAEHALYKIQNENRVPPITN